MSQRSVKIPGPDHPITVKPNPGRVIVRVADRIIADSISALTLTEASYPAVQYIPRCDVDMAALERSKTSTFCPYKGEASYFSIPAGGANSVDAIWSYEAPYPAVASIKEYLAFYPSRVTAIELLAP